MALLDGLTVVAFAKRQMQELGFSDGILSLEMERELGICIFRDGGCQ